MEKLYCLAIALLISVQIAVGIDRLNPRSLIECYTCSGITCSRESFINQTEICADPLDNCVTVFDQYSVISRGCYSEIPDQYREKCESADNIECDKCSGSLCNKYARADLTCLHCNSSIDKSCLQNPDTLEAARCPITVAPNTYCFIKFTEDSTIRGCTPNLQEESSCYEDENCFMCLPQSGRPCNQIEFPAGRRQCLACSGQNCTMGQIATVYCNYSTDECVSMKMSEQIVRNCLRELEPSQRKFCTDNSKSCTRCQINNCNIDVPNNGDRAGHVVGVLMSITSIMLIFHRAV